MITRKVKFYSQGSCNLVKICLSMTMGNKTRCVTEIKSADISNLFASEICVGCLD